jgi:hypothetical protein
LSDILTDSDYGDEDDEGYLATHFLAECHEDKKKKRA